MTDPQALRARRVLKRMSAWQEDDRAGYDQLIEIACDLKDALDALLAREALTPAEEAEDAADARELSEAYRQHETAGLSRYPIPYAGAGGGTAMRDEPAVTQAARAVLAAVERGADPTQWFDALAVLRGAVDTADALLAREAPAPATPALIRYGVLHHTEGELYSHAPMADGYWTPWHFAQATIADLEARVQAAEAKVEALQAALQEAYVVLAGLERGVLRALDTGEYQTRDLRAEVEARLAEWSKPSGTPLVASGRVAAYHDVLALLAQAPEVNWKAPR